MYILFILMLLVRMINKRIKEYFIFRLFISWNGRLIDLGIVYNFMFNMLMFRYYDDGIDKKKNGNKIRYLLWMYMIL